MNVFLVAPETSRVTVGFIAAAKVTIERFPIAMRLHVAR